MTPLPHSVSCWNLAGLSERVAKETVNEINLQFHVRRLRERQDRRPRVYRANIQICNHLCPAYVYSYRIVMGGKGAARHSSSRRKKKEKKTLFCMSSTACFSHRGTEYRTVMKSNLGAHFEIHWRCNYFSLKSTSSSMKTHNKHGRGVRNFTNHDSKSLKNKPTFNLTGNQAITNWVTEPC